MASPPPPTPISSHLAHGIHPSPESSENLAFGGPLQDHPPPPPPLSLSLSRSPSLQREIDRIVIDPLLPPLSASASPPWPVLDHPDSPLTPPELGVPALPADVQPPRIRFGAIMALNQSALTRAIGNQDFELAERLITTSTDPEFLNAGRGANIPLNLLILGRERDYLDWDGLTRHFRLVRLLLERGADVNLRNHLPYFETDAESPLEFLLAFYQRCAECWKRGRNESELLNTIGSHGETNLSLKEVMEQAKALLTDCLGQYGGLPNLQTTTCGQTIFHMAMTAPVMDPDVIEQMIALRALINLTDFHGTTPLMDLIQSRNVEHVKTVFRLAQNHGKSFALNVQNCVGQSALWRAMFQGDVAIAQILLEEGASSFTMARSMANPGGMKYPHRAESSTRPEVSLVPACLAPLLGNSLDNETWPQKLYPMTVSKGCCKKIPNSFDVSVFNRIIRKSISPLVDLGWFCTADVETPMKELLQETTAFGHLTKEKVFQKLAIIPLMFGHLSGGLAQLCIRHILNLVLFNQRDGVMLRHFLNSLVVTPRFVTPLGPSPFQQLGQTVKPKAKPTHHPHHRYRKSSSSSVNPGTSSSTNLDDSACIIQSGSSFNSSSVALELSRITLSEPEMESVVPGEETDRRIRHSSSPKSQQQHWRFDENWHLQQDPTFQRPKGSEDLPSESQDIQEEVQSSLRQTEELLTQVDTSIQDLTLFRQVEQILAEEDPPAFPETDSSEDAIPVACQTTTTDSNSDSSSSDHTWDGVFSLRHACYKNSSYYNIPCAPFGPPDHEEILVFLDPSNSLELTQALGLPMSLRPLVELEIARLQLGLILYRHQSIACDRGCEGNDSDSDSWDSWSTHSGPSMTSTNDLESSLNDVESDYSSPRPFEPSIPQQPRILSGSSSSSSSSSDPPSVRNEVVGEEEDALPLEEDWFSFQDPDHDLVTSQRYVREHLISSVQNFNESTDSDTTSSSSSVGIGGRRSN